MSYPDKLLSQDEKVVEHLHPSWITLVPATLWFLVICAAAGAGIAYAPDSGTSRSVVIIAIIVVGFILLCWLSFTPWIQWRTSHYVFTTHRVLIRKGVLRRTGRDIALQRISDVAFSQSLWDRLVRAGTLTIESAGEQGQEVMNNMPRSDDMQQVLNRLIQEDNDRRARQAYGGGYQQGPGQYPPQGPPYPPTQPYPQG
ncbi:MAG TPA: PH domain-containing protein [Jatrophihabitans sp.]|nr:PH domain-containing protein [Jatrophihabitans sp.]